MTGGRSGVWPALVLAGVWAAWPLGAPAAAAPGRKAPAKKQPAARPACTHVFKDALPLILTGDHPVALAAADLDADGRTDLVVLESSFLGSAGVHLGRPGGFATPSPNPVGSYPAAMVLADLDGDSQLDLAVADQHVVHQRASGTVSVLKGSGGGRFASRATYAVGEAPRDIAAADVDGDGRLDLIVVSGKREGRAIGRVEILRGQEGGGFAEPAGMAQKGAPAAVAATDFDGDGKVDLAVANQEAATVSILVGKGGGSFARARALPVVDEPSALKALDLDGDGRTDLVVLGRGGLSVLRRGPVDFEGEARVAVGGTPVALAAHDLDGDGRLDLVAALAEGAAAVLLARAEGGFAAPALVQAGPSPTALLVHDADGDGLPDLLVASGAADAVRVLQGTGTGAFRAPPLAAAGTFQNALAAGDLNGDGAPDLVAASERTNQAMVLVNSGGGAFREAGAARLGQAPIWVGLADLDGDRALDLISLDSGRRPIDPKRANPEEDLAAALKAGRGRPGQATLSVLAGAGAGAFGKRIAYPVGAAVWGAALADVDSDRKLDVAVADGAGRLEIFHGAGDGTFAEKSEALLAPLGERAAPPAGARAPQKSDASMGRLAIAAGDFDGDARMDLAVAAWTAREVQVLKGDPTMGFLSGGAYPTDPLPAAIAAGDLDGDGRPDLAVAAHGDDSSAGRVTVLLGDVKGGFVRAGSLGAGEKPSSLAIADLDGDGRADIAVGNVAGVLVLRGLGAGKFAPGVPWPAGPSPALVAADFDRDGRPDVAAAAEDGVTVLLGACR